METFLTFLKNLLKWFLSGLIVLLPLGATLILLGWILNFLDSLIGGQSFFGQIWKGGFGWLNVSDALLFLMGYIFFFTLITVVGYFAQGFARDRFTASLRTFFNKIPVLNKIYNSFEQLIKLWSQKQTGEDMSKIGEVVIVQFMNVKVLGVLSSRNTYRMYDEEYYLVYFPSAPIPATGFTYFFKIADVSFCDMKMEDMTKVVVSLGVLGQEVLGKSIPLYDKPQPIKVTPAPAPAPETAETAAEVPVVAPETPVAAPETPVAAPETPKTAPEATTPEAPVATPESDQEAPSESASETPSETPSEKSPETPSETSPKKGPEADQS